MNGWQGVYQLADFSLQMLATGAIAVGFFYGIHKLGDWYFNSTSGSDSSNAPSQNT